MPQNASLVDIDAAYRSWTDSRDRALQTIDQTLTLIIANNKLPGIGFRKQTSSLETPKLIIENEMAQVKIEVNTVFRGTVLPVDKSVEIVSSEDKRAF